MYLQIDVPKTDCTYEHTIIAKVSSYRIFREGEAETWYFENPCPLLLEDDLCSPSGMILEKRKNWNYYSLAFDAVEEDGKAVGFDVKVKKVKTVLEIPSVTIDHTYSLTGL